jgi:hypothetical protein
MPHPFNEKKIHLKGAEELEMIDESENQAKGDSDEEINENKQSTRRHRIMSDYWSYMIPD